MTDRQSVRGRRRRSRRSPEDRRRALLAAARRRFSRSGYAGTTVASIVRDAGVAQGTFYLYFKNKEDVLVHLRVQILEDLLAAFERGIEGSGPPDARLVTGIGRIYEAVRRNRKLLRAVRQAIRGDEIERVWLEGRSVLARPLRTLLEKGAAADRFAIDDPEVTAHLVLSLLDDLFYEALVHRKPAPGPVTRHLATRFVLRALGTPVSRIDALLPGKEAAA